jgi:flagellar hook assembly protein FlgD
VIEDFGRPVFESITMAEEELLALYPNNPMIARQIQTMSKLGSALTRIGLIDEVVGVGDNVPHQTALGQNYPNPFNPKTTIRFNLEKPSKVTLKVFDVRGSLIATLADENLPAGPQHRVWNGSNDHGQFVASGTYFYRLEAGDKSVSRKMLLLK